ncbi:hypothetical protein SEA_WOLLYPOG_70 [Arthrobacter phage Wollypog]|uniref:Uncharacterized protein n=1 Tax=Arthrobacter phage Wollypog TaxID=2790985 RepID=A0A7T3KCA0_9CAUD|nr:hypothetical protein PP291_gp70 [Arthrobacter phage Wollypog]QPX62620.1 hypothetical protein SEA_WOLLYPOG_70 [Arthrobacter phage Wollypog]
MREVSDGGTVNAGQGRSAEADAEVGPLRMAFRGLWSWLLQDNSLSVPVSQRSLMDRPAFDLSSEIKDRLFSEYTTSYNRFDGPLVRAAVEAQAKKEAEMSTHAEVHGYDTVGTYNKDCPECNHPYMQVVQRLMVIHKPVSLDAGISWVCDHCNKPGGGDVVWPCVTFRVIAQNFASAEWYTLIPEDVRATYRRFYGVDIDGHTSDRGGTGEGDHPSQEDVAVLRRDAGVRTVRQSQAGYGASGMPEGLLTPSVSAVQGGKRHPAHRAGGPDSGARPGAGTSSEAGMVQTTGVAVSELKRCERRRHRSSVEKCGMYLVVGLSGVSYCVQHGPV